MKFFSIISFILVLSLPSWAGDDLIDLARISYQNGDYYHSLTELMRYQYLYPQGKRYGDSLILMGKSYYMGGNSRKALYNFNEAYFLFPGDFSGQQGLYYGALVRIKRGSYYFGIKRFKEYLSVYKDGYYADDALFYLCTATALSEDYNEAIKYYGLYDQLYPEGRHRNEIATQRNSVQNEQKRKPKSPWIAGLSSAVIPGAGYVYAGEYMLGLLSFVTNASLIYLAYDGYKKDSPFQMIFFSFFEISFYNHSIVGSIRKVKDYNSRKELSRELLLGIEKAF